MTTESWDPDQAVVHGPVDEDLEGTWSVDRYGVTGDEEVHGEPLDVALAQEEPDPIATVGADDQWVLVDDEDLGQIRFADRDGRAPEELAMHLERM